MRRAPSRRTSRGAAPDRRLPMGTRAAAARGACPRQKQRTKREPSARRLSLRALEDVGVRHLHAAAAFGLREHPAPDVRQDAALHRLARERRLLHERVGNPAGAVDDEEDRDLAIQPGIAGQLFLVAVLHFIIVALDDAVDHVAREAADHHRLAGDEARLLLALSAQFDAAVAAFARSGSLDSQAADTDGGAASAGPGSATSETADAVRVTESRARFRAAKRGIHAAADTARPEDVRGGTGACTDLRQRGDQPELGDLAPIRFFLLRVGDGRSLARGICLLLLRVFLAQLSFLACAFAPSGAPERSLNLGASSTLGGFGFATYCAIRSWVACRSSADPG